MKKIISILLVLTMVIGLAAIPVWALPPTATVVKPFYYQGEIMRNVVVVDMSITVRGTYSRVGDDPYINSITATADGPAAYRLTFNYTTSGNKGTLQVYDLGVYIFKYVFTISDSGTITLDYKCDV